MMLVPDDKGGSGASLSEALVILRAAGEAAAPGPLLETMLGQSLLARAGLDSVDGLIALAFVDSADECPSAGANSWTSPAPLHDVPWGGVVDHVLIVVRAQDAARLILTRSSDWSVVPGSDAAGEPRDALRSEEHTSELQSLMRISYAVFCLKKKKTRHKDKHIIHQIIK